MTPNLSETLRAAEDRDERALRVGEHAGQRLDLARQQQTRVGGQEVRDALGRRVRAVRRTERVVDVDVGERGERRGELGVVRLLARLEAHVLEHDDLAVDHAVDGLVRLGADDVVDEDDVAAEQALQHAAHRPQRELRVRLALRPAEVADDDDAGAVVDEVAQRRQRRAHAGVVGDGARRASGTLKSTRTSTRLPRTSTSLTVFFANIGRA